jgi:hypothetical protein
MGADYTDAAATKNTKRTRIASFQSLETFVDGFFQSLETCCHADRKNEMTAENFPFNCVPRGLTKERFKQWLIDDPAHCDELMKEMRALAAGTFAGWHAYTPEEARKLLPGWIGFIARMKAVGLAQKLEEIAAGVFASQATDPAQLARANKLADALRDAALDLDEPVRSELTARITSALEKLRQLSTPEMVQSGCFLKARPKFDVLLEAVKKWEEGDHSPGHRAHCLALVEDFMKEAGHFDAEAREELMPSLYALREDVLRSGRAADDAGSND